MPTTAKPKRRRLQFSLRTLLLAVGVVSVPIAWLASIMRESRQQRDVVERIGQHGGFAEYDYQWDEDGRMISGGQPPGPGWLRRIIGENCFANVVRVVCESNQITDEDLGLIVRLSKLRWLTIADSGITPSGFQSLEAASNLRYLWLFGPKINDAALRHMEKLPALQGLRLNLTSVTDNGVETVWRFAGLRGLSIRATHITDTGLANLHRLKNLTSLDLEMTDVGDGVFEQIKDMPRLKDLELRKTRITDAGLAAFGNRRNLTNLRVEDTGLTDAVVPVLRDLVALQSLDIIGTKISWAGFEEIKRALPKATIVWAK